MEVDPLRASVAGTSASVAGTSTSVAGTDRVNIQIYCNSNRYNYNI